MFGGALHLVSAHGAQGTTAAQEGHEFQWWSSERKTPRTSHIFDLELPSSGMYMYMYMYIDIGIDVDVDIGSGSGIGIGIGIGIGMTFTLYTLHFTLETLHFTLSI